MNVSLQDKLMEVAATNNIAYILKNNSDFSVTGYKVMQNQSGTSLLPCAKLMYNGKVKLVYIVGSCKPLSFVATRLGASELHATIYNLIQKVMDIQGNGFFVGENIDLDFDKIFVDTSDYSVRLIYFPVSNNSTTKISSFDNEFRVALINLFNSYPVFSAPQFQRVCSDLSNGSLSMIQILKKMQDSGGGAIAGQAFASKGSMYDGNNDGIPDMRGNGAERFDQRNDNRSIRQDQGYQQVQNGNFGGNACGVDFRGGVQNRDFSNDQSAYNNGAQRDRIILQPSMTIQSIGSPVQVIMTVDVPEFSIGKNPAAVNGAVTYNPAISRIHCKISFSNGKYYLTDLGSANGTFLNQQKLNAQQPAELHSGDYIRLANSDFIISF